MSILNIFQITFFKFLTQELTNKILSSQEEDKKEENSKKKKSVFYPLYIPDTSLFFRSFLLLIFFLFHITAIISTIELRDYNHFEQFFPLDIIIYYLTC